MDIVRNIQEFNTGRDPERLAMKYRNMRSNPFVFLRATCHLFYGRLPSSRLFERAPSAWVCGDLHLENFGSYKGDNRLVYFDVNDFDEAALAPVTWELVRFLSSILVGAKSLKVAPPEALALCHTFVDHYAAALALGKARWVEKETAEGMIGQLLDSVQRRPRPLFLDSRTEKIGKKRRIRIDGRKALAVTDKQRKKVADLISEFAATQDNPRFYKVLDVARRIAGTGSLGVDRYIVLVEGKGSPDRNYLLDLKAASPSSLSPHLKIKQPFWQDEAHRVAAIQRRFQAVSMAFLQPVTLARKSYVLRGLLPSEDRVALNAWKKRLRRLENVMATMGEIVAWDQLRSSGRDGSAIADELIDFGEQNKWRSSLIDAARHCADQVEKDWAAYSSAYDDGFFKL
ncbi:hypothetical protein DLREEDagrD3_14030 [Denitratisoma sp. agr-D3]